MPATRIARITRFTEPGVDEVIDFIKRNAKNVLTNPINKTNYEDMLFGISNLLRLLPPSEVRDISMGNSEYIDHLRRHYQSRGPIESEVYLMSTHGIIPSEALNKIKQSNKHTGTVCSMVTHMIGMNVWDLRIRLSNACDFPDSLELGYLLDRKVKDSDLFSVTGDYEDYKIVANHIRLLSNVLSSPEDMMQIRDASHEILQMKAARTLKETIDCRRSSETVGKLTEVLEDIINSINIPHNLRKPFGPEDASLN